MPEFCESMMKKEELEEQVFDDDAVTPSIAIFSYEPISLHQGREKRERKTKTLNVNYN